MENTLLRGEVRHLQEKVNAQETLIKAQNKGGTTMVREQVEVDAQGDTTGTIEGPTLRGKPWIVDTVVVRRPPIEPLREESRRLQEEMANRLEQLFEGRRRREDSGISPSESFL